jgi:hypothetical protein
VILHTELGSYGLRIEFLRIGIIKGTYLVLKTIRTYGNSGKCFGSGKGRCIGEQVRVVSSILVLY